MYAEKNDLWLFPATVTCSRCLTESPSSSTRKPRLRIKRWLGRILAFEADHLYLLVYSPYCDRPNKATCTTAKTDSALTASRAKPLPASGRPSPAVRRLPIMPHAPLSLRPRCHRGGAAAKTESIYKRRNAFRQHGDCSQLPHGCKAGTGQHRYRKSHKKQRAG
jgi:hypothetical protein